MPMRHSNAHAQATAQTPRQWAWPHARSSLSPLRKWTAGSQDHPAGQDHQALPLGKSTAGLLLSTLRAFSLPPHTPPRPRRRHHHHRPPPRRRRRLPCRSQGAGIRRRPLQVVQGLQGLTRT